jgi:hypothetical protein
LNNERRSAKMRGVREALANRRHDFTEKHAPVKSDPAETTLSQYRKGG